MVATSNRRLAARTRSGSPGSGRMSHWARATLVLLLLLPATAVVEVASQSSALAAGCSRGGCTGKDPEVQGCSGDGRTVANFTAQDPTNGGGTVYVELRHSNTCKAKWLRVTMSAGPHLDCGGGAPGQVRLRNLRKNGTQISMVRKQFVYNCDHSVWTTMLGRTTDSYKVGFCWREASAWGGAWGFSPYYAPCKRNIW